MVKYTPYVGAKFDKSGGVLPFPGNTVISGIGPDMPVYAGLVAAQSRFKDLECTRKYAFLPPSSFHMTVIEGLCDQVRTPERWSTMLPLDAPLSETNTFLMDRFQKIAPPDSVEMRVAGIESGGVLKIILEPGDENSMRAIRGYRDRFADITGIRFPDHDAYRFHISLAYNLIHLTDAERSQINQACASQFRELSGRTPSFALAQPRLSSFDNMFAFKDFAYE